MAKRLARYVYVENPQGSTVRLGPGDPVPDWAEKQITNPKAWAEPGEDDEEDDPEAARYAELKAMKVPELEELADKIGADRAGVTRKGPLIDLILDREAEIAKEKVGGGS